MSDRYAEGYRAGLRDAERKCREACARWVETFRVAIGDALDGRLPSASNDGAVAANECADAIRALAAPAPAPVLDLGVDTPWRLLSVLEHLIATARVLLNEHNYAGHGYELMREAQQAAERYAEQLRNDPASALDVAEVLPLVRAALRWRDASWCVSGHDSLAAVIDALPAALKRAAREGGEHE